MSTSIRRLGRPEGLAATRLLCLPPAGAGPSLYYGLLALDSSAVEICPVSLPGRENRLSEALPASMDELAERLARELAPALDRDYAILGYSMGALLGHELIRRWRAWGLPEPGMFFALGARAPQVPFARDVPLHQLGEEAFKQALIDIGGTPPELLQDAEAMAIFEPILRGDLRNCETYAYRPMPPLSMPIHAFVGDDDTLMTADDAAPWQTLTTGAFELHRMATGHLLSRPDLLALGQRIVALWTAAR